MLLEGFPLWYFETNCWIVAPRPGDAGEPAPCVVVDAPPDPDAIADRLERHRLEPVALLATHGHLDHAGGIGFLVERFPMPVHVHDRDRPHVEDPSLQARFLLRDPVEFPVPPTIETVDDGDVLELAGLRFTVLHTPGHTPGSTCYLLEAPDTGGAPDDPATGEPRDPSSDGGGRLLFSGDHLFAGSVGRSDLPGGDWHELMRSMRERILVLAPGTRVAPGHGPSTTIGREVATNPFLTEARFA